MADELKQSQLARIVVPAITDAEYSKNLADAFEKINDNFKKIASLPFLQGVQGDSYQLEEYPIWEKDTIENWVLTEDGKILLDSIFGIDTTEYGTSFNDIRACIGEELNGVSPIDFFMTEEDTIVNNSLYFYVIKDDTGNIIEKQLGQYYYFVDGRIKEIGNIYNSENSGSVLSVFNDYTGFYQYKYDAENLKDEYIKIEILPTIYYDQNKNDICWKFNGNETGISAIGVKGADGKDAELSIVQVDLNNENGIYSNSSASGIVVGILSTSANNGESAQWITDPAYFKTGKALIYMSGKIPVENSEEGAEEGTVNPLSGETETNEITINDFAFGEIIKQNDEYIAYWEPNCVFSKVITNNAFTQYFYNMGTVSYTNNAPYFLAIPSIQNRDSSTEEAKKHAHIIKGYDGDKDSNIESLNIFHSDNAFDEVGNQQINAVESSSDKILNIKNYDVNISKTLTAKGKITGTADLEISGTTDLGSSLTVGGTLGVAGAADLGSSLTVRGGATITGYTEIKGCATITGGTSTTENGNTGLTLYGQRSINIGGVGLETQGGFGTQEGGTGLVVHGGSGGVTGKSIEAHGDVSIDGNMNVIGGVEIYSGTGADSDDNILKLSETSVDIIGTKGLLFVSGDVQFGNNLNVNKYLSVGDEIFTETLTVADSITAGYTDSAYINSKDAYLENLEVSNEVFKTKINSDDELIYITNSTYPSIQNLVNTYWDESTKNNNASGQANFSNTGYSGLTKHIISYWYARTNKATITCPKIYYIPKLTITSKSNYTVQGCDITYVFKIYLEDINDKTQIEILSLTGTKTNDGDTKKNQSVIYEWDPIFSNTTSKEVEVTTGHSYRLVLYCSLTNIDIDIPSVAANNVSITDRSYSVYSENNTPCTISQTYAGASSERKTIIFNNGIITGANKGNCGGLLVNSGNIVTLFGTKYDGTTVKYKSVPLNNILDTITGSTSDWS